jgi:hypothetical protein
MARLRHADHTDNSDDYEIAEEVEQVLNYSSHFGQSDAAPSEQLDTNLDDTQRSEGKISKLT